MSMAYFEMFAHFCFGMLVTMAVVHVVCFVVQNILEGGR